MAALRPHRRRPFKIKAVSLAVASCFSVSAETALANPTGGVVVSGSATFNQQGNQLSITNTPGAIINWRAFSIGPNELTRFIQQSSASSVLNRVVGVDPSVILGALQSNGRVFLINPNGILFGAGAQIDVAGLVASTLNLSNADFAAGRLRFTETPGAGSITNQGSISTPGGGQVYLIAPDIQNTGIITSPKGEVILAAGRTVELVDAGTPNLRIEITAPDTQAVNIGQIVASSGKIGIYAGLIKNSGEVRADGVVVGQNGEILLKATNRVALEKGSIVSASGPTAGKVTIQADSGIVTVAGTVAANASQGAGGAINIAGAQGVSVEPTARISADGMQGGSVALASASGNVTVAAPVTANATAGRAGRIAINAASAVILANGAQLSASGGLGTGTVTVNGGSAVVMESGSAAEASGAAGGAVNMQVEQGSFAGQGTIDVTATDSSGGTVNIAADGDITLDAASRILARGRAGGEMRIESSKGTLLAAGLIDGQGSNGPGGTVYLLAPRVALIQRALIDVSGATRGGTVLIGGDFQGHNLLVQNASRTYFGPDALIRADAKSSGDGGKVIIWSNDGTQAYGTVSARGGAISGNGGFVEVSGKAWLDFAATVDTSAPHGAFGTLLLDPVNIDVNDAGGAAYGGNNLFGDPGANSIILANGAGSISAQSTDVLLQAENDITFTSAFTIANPGTKLTAQAGRSIIVNTSFATTNGDITLVANENHATSTRVAGAATISMAPGATINAGTANIYLVMREGFSHVGGVGVSDSGNIVVGNLTAANVSIVHDGLTADSAILRASAGSLITASSAVFMELEYAGGALASIGTESTPIRVSTPALEAHYHSASGGIFIDSPNPQNLQIGGVPALIFSGLVRGVQTISGGPIEITVNGKLTQFAGTGAVCGMLGGTGGPICAGGGTYNPGDSVTLRANDMDLLRPVSGWDVYLRPGAGGGITLGSAGTGGSLHLSQSEINQIDAYAVIIGEADVSGNVVFAGDLITPSIFHIHTGGSITSGLNTLTVGALGDGNTDLYATTGIQINVQAKTLSAYNAGATGHINIAETGAGGGTLTLDHGVDPGSSLRNDAAAGDITLTTATRSLVVESSIVGQRDITLTATNGDIWIGAPSAPVTVNAGRDLFINAAGTLTVQAGDTNLGSGSSRDASTKVHANRHLTVNAAGLTVAAGTAAASGTVTAAETAKADAELTANGNMTLTIGTAGAAIRAGNAQVDSTSGDVYDASANVKVSAAGTLSINVAGGGLFIGSGQAHATAHEGNATATANANTLVSAGGAFDITVTGSNLVIGGGTARAHARHNVSATSAVVGGDNAAIAKANIKVQSGAALTVTADGLRIYGGSAGADAYKFVTGSSNTVSGNNTAMADSNIDILGVGVGLNLGAGQLLIQRGNASGEAYHYSAGVNQLISGNHSAVANSNIALNAGTGPLTVAAGSVVLGDGGEGGYTRAYMYGGGSNNAIGASAGPASNSAAGNSNISVSGGSVALTLSGGLTIDVGGAYTDAYHAATGSTNTLGGNNDAIANSNVTVCAGTIAGAVCTPSGALTITAPGGVNLLGNGSSGSSAAAKSVSGNNHTLSGNNTENAVSNIGLLGSAITIDVGPGNLNISGARLTAHAQGTVTGDSNSISGNQTKSVTSNIALKATGGALTINAAGGNVDISAGSVGAVAYKQTYSGNNNVLSGNNTATATSNVDLQGVGVTINLGTGGLSIRGRSANAQAYHEVSGGANQVSGVNSATAINNIGIAATGGGALSVTAGGLSLADGGEGGAFARAYMDLGSGGTGNTIGGTAGFAMNTASANRGITLAGSNITLDVGSGSVSISGARARADAYHHIGGISNHATGDLSANAVSNVTINTTGALSVTATGGMNIRGSSASANAYKYLSGTSFGAAGNNSATANSTVNLSGNSVALNLGTAYLQISGSSAGASAYHYVAPGSVSAVTGGVHMATANSIISVAATGGALTIAASGGISIYGDDTWAAASKSVHGSNHVIAGDNTALATSNVDVRGSSVTLNLGAGSLNIYGDSASASAYQYAAGNTNTLSDIHKATSFSNISLTATAGALTVNAGGITIQSGGMGASAYKQVNGGSGNTLSGTNTAAANGIISLNGTSVALNLGTGNFVADGAEGGVAVAFNSVSGTGNTLSGGNNANAFSNILLTGTNSLSIQAGSVSVQPGNIFVVANNDVSGGSFNTISAPNIAMADGNIRLLASLTSLSIDAGSGSIYAGAGSAQALALNTGTAGAGNTATAHANALFATGGDISINGGSLTVQGGGASAATSGSGAQVANANANAGILALGTNTVSVTGSVDLIGGSVLSISGPGAAASSFALLDPAALTINANAVNLTTNAGGVILSAFGPISINTAAMGFVVDGTPGDFSSFGGAPGVNFGQPSPIISTLTSSDPLIISFGGTSKNLTNLFGLPMAFLPPPPGIIYWDGEAGDNLWLSPSNWLGDSLPGFTNSVVIGAFGPITLTGAANIKSLLSDSGIILSGAGAVLTLSNPSTVNATLSINGGTLNANGGITIANLNLASGTLNGLGNLVIGNSYIHTGGSIATTFDLIDITQAAGNLTLNNPLSATSVYLTAPNGNITEGGANTINTLYLAVASGGNVTLNGPNTALNLVADLTLNGGTGSFSFTNSGGFNVAGAPINGILGVKTNGGDITLTTTGASSGIFVQPTFGAYAVDTGPSGSGILSINSSEWLVVNDFGNLRGGKVVLSSGNNLGIAIGQANIVATGGAVNSVDLIANTGPIKSSADITAAGGVRMFTGAVGPNGAINLDNGHGGSTITAAGLVDIQAGGAIQAYDETTFTSANTFANITGSNVSLNAGSFIHLGGAPGQGNLTATTGNVAIVSGGSFGGAGSSGSISAPLGNVTVTAGGFAEFDGTVAASAGAGTIGITASGIYVGGTMNAKTISLDSTDVTLNAANDVIYLYNGANITGATVAMQAVGNMYLEGATLTATKAGLANAAPAISLLSTAGNINAPASMTTVSGAVTLNAAGFVEMDAASNGGTISAAGDASITAGSSISALGVAPGAAWMQVSGTNVTLNAGTFVSLGAVSGHGLTATNGNVNVTAGTSMGGTAPGSMKGPIVAINGDVHISLLGAGGPGTSFFDFGDSISAAGAGHTVVIDNGGGGPVNASINVAGPIAAGSTITLKAANFIDIGPGGLTSSGGNIIVNSGDLLFSSGAISAGGSINLTSGNGMSVLVASNGSNLAATNNGSGNLILTSNAPVFTVGGGGAALTNNAPGGQYYVTAVNDMVVAGPTGNSRYEVFGAGNLLTVNGYANMSGLGVLMTANNVDFSGAMTDISGPLGVLAGNLNVYSTVQAGSVNVVASNLNVDGGIFKSMNANFVGSISGNVNVSNGGIVYGNPDIDLTVGGTVNLDNPGSLIEAASANSIHLTFPQLQKGGFFVNGAADVVWDPVTGTGFFAGGLPAVLGSSLLIDYGLANGLVQSVVAAINTTIAAVDQSVISPLDKKDNDGNKEATQKDEKSLGNNLKMMCN